MREEGERKREEKRARKEREESESERMRDDKCDNEMVAIPAKEDAVDVCHFVVCQEEIGVVGVSSHIHLLSLQRVGKLQHETNSTR